MKMTGLAAAVYVRFQPCCFDFCFWHELTVTGSREVSQRTVSHRP